MDSERQTIFVTTKSCGYGSRIAFAALPCPGRRGGSCRFPFQFNNQRASRRVVARLDRAIKYSSCFRRKATAYWMPRLKRGMTAEGDMSPYSRGTMRPSCRKRTTLDNQEGAGNAGCALHP